MESIICRDEQLSLISSLVGENQDFLLPHCLYLYGHRNTGKTFVIKNILSSLNVQICSCNCIEFYSTRIMFEEILNQLSETSISSENNFLPFASCDNLDDFVKNINKISTQNPSRRMAILLEHSERLRDCDVNILPGICRLQEMTSANIMVVLMSTIPFEKLRPSTGLLEPIQIFFPQYKKDEVIEILMEDCPADCPTEFYSMFIMIILNIFYTATTNLNELRHLARINFSEYCAPIGRGEATVDDYRALWKNIEPCLKKALSTVYLREVSSDQFQRMQQSMQGENESSFKSFKSSMTKMELPYYSKYLLIASYLASYNPAKSDKRFFMKHHGKQRNSQATIKAKHKACSQLVGPKPFPLDRMLAIFYSIIEEKVAPTANVFSQITTLVTLRLITQIGSDDQLDTPKYKSCVSLDFIRHISKTVDFDVVRYLYDFA